MIDCRLDLLLLLDDALNLAVFDRFQRRDVYLALGALLARFFERGRTQQAADVIGTERRLGALSHSLFRFLLSAVMPANAGIQ